MVIHVETWSQVSIEIISFQTILADSIVPCDIVTQKIEWSRFSQPVVFVFISV
jgi:hypothetical protein